MASSISWARVFASVSDGAEQMFTVHPDEIKDFTGDQLVALLRRLLYAEARKGGVPLRGVEVPMQITVADGGQDGSISWEGGHASTDYLPGRDIVFQCKAKDSGHYLPAVRKHQVG